MSDRRSFFLPVFCSVLLHALPVALVVLVVKNQKPVKVISVQVLKVDMLGLPSLTLKELRQLRKETSPTAQAPTVQVDGAAVKRKARKKLQGLLQNLGKKKVGSKKRRTRPTGDAKALQQLIVAGNKLSAGSALEGDKTSNALTSDLDLYGQSVAEEVRMHWTLPSALVGRNLRAVVRIYISASGTLLKRELEKSSGNNVFDQRVLAAVDAVTHFNPPPGKIVRAVQRGQVLLGFPL